MEVAIAILALVVSVVGVYLAWEKATEANDTAKRALSIAGDDHRHRTLERQARATEGQRRAGEPP